jgi:hypothetical protein
LTFNPVAAILIADKIWPEHPSFPESLENATPLELAEARSRLAQIGQIASELRKLVDQQLAEELANGSLRYGDSIIRPAYRGRPKVVDEGAFWDAVVAAVDQSLTPDALLSALFPASSVRLGALTKLAAQLEVDPDTLKQTLIDYEPPTAALDVIPISKARVWEQKLEDGQISTKKGTGPDPD